MGILYYKLSRKHAQAHKKCDEKWREPRGKPGMFPINSSF